MGTNRLRIITLPAEETEVSLSRWDFPLPSLSGPERTCQRGFACTTTRGGAERPIGTRELSVFSARPPRRIIPAMERMLEATARAEDDHFWFRALRRNASRTLESALGGRAVDWIVDCGAGTGRNLDWLNGFGRTLGVELTPAGLRVGRALGRRMVQGTVAALPIADRCADVATSFDVLYCLDDETETRAVAEMWRVLKPGGVALFNVAALEILHGSHSALTHERRRYTPARLKVLLSEAGFTVERLTFTNMATFPVTLAVRTLDRLTGRAAQPSEADLTVPARPVNLLFDWVLRVEGQALRAVNLPIGTSLLCVARKPEA
jgi:SAM-dependent methyltransferase